MSKKSLLGLVLLTGLVTLFSCRKEISNIFGNEALKETQWAKDYFNNVLLRNEGNQVLNKNSNANSSTMSSTGKIPNIKTPLWVRAKSSQTSKYTFVEIPLKYSQKISRAVARKNETVSPELIEASFDRLIIYKDKKGVISQRIVSYIPDKAYLERHRGDISHNTIDKLDKDFSGYLRYADWDGTPLARLRIDKGVSRKMKQQLSVVSKNKRIKANTLSSKDQQAGNPNNTLGETCYDVWEIEYSQTCHYANPDDIVPTHCDTPIEVGRTWIDYLCVDDGELDPDDCSDPRNFENPDCQGPGGTGEEDPFVPNFGTNVSIDAGSDAETEEIVGLDTGKVKNVSWYFHQGPEYEYKSTERAYVKIKNGVRKFHTLVHQGIEYTGTTTNYEVELLNLSFTMLVQPNGSAAQSAARYKIKLDIEAGPIKKHHTSRFYDSYGHWDTNFNFY